MSRIKFGSPWTKAEDSLLKRLRQRALVWADISVVIGRTPDACCARFTKLQDLAERGVDPYEVRPAPAARPARVSLPRPFYEPGANQAGCIAHHEALMRFYERRMQHAA